MSSTALRDRLVPADSWLPTLETQTRFIEGQSSCYTSFWLWYVDVWFVPGRNYGPPAPSQTQRSLRLFSPFHHLIDPNIILLIFLWGYGSAVEGHRADRDEEELTNAQRLPVRSITALHMVMSQDAKASEGNISWSAKICAQLGYDLRILGCCLLRLTSSVIKNKQPAVFLPWPKPCLN